MISRFLAAAMAVFFAVSASQLPEFAQQYRQRLGGAVDELRMVVERFDQDARAQGLNRDEALKRHFNNGDELFRRRGAAMVGTLDRYERLAIQQAEFKGDLPVSRLLGLATLADNDVANATLKDYEPAIPVTTEGGILAAIGAFLGFAVARLLGWPKRVLARKLAAGRASRETRS